MPQKRKRLLAILLALPLIGMFLVAREAASWRPQLVGVPHTDVYQFEISPDGRFAAIQGDVVELFELATGTETVLSRKALGVNGDVCFSPDGRYLAWCEWRHPFPKNLKTYYRPREDTVIVWDTVKQRIARTIPVSFSYESTVPAKIAFNPHNVLMFRRGSKLLQIPANGASVIEKRLSLPIFDQGLRLTADGLQLTGIDRQNSAVIRIFDASTLKSIARIVTPKPLNPKYGVIKFPSQNLYAAAGEVYSPTSSRPLWKFSTTQWFFSPDGRTLVLLNNNQFELRNSKNGTILRAPTTLGIEGPYYTYAFEPGGSHLLFYKNNYPEKSGRFLRQRIQ
ncbi:hypothetical protein IAD21_05246 [Abditibacteriota bacterium]|nr:hypothetical protein IAD21_05246 [Abditibacteriota bacterium]